MAYYQPPKPVVEWDRPGWTQGVTIKRQLDDGNWYAWKIPYDGVVSQAMAADILRVSVMTINNWVNAGDLKHIKSRGQASLIPARGDQEGEESTRPVWPAAQERSRWLMQPTRGLSAA